MSACPPSRRALLAGLAASIVPLPARAQTKPPAAPPRLVLKAQPFEKRLRPDATIEASLLGYQGQCPGPLLRVTKGQPLDLRLENGLQEPTSLHFYGVRGRNAMDGVAGLTQAAVKPGDTFDYTITPPDAGIFWYHALVQGRASEQVDRGLYGMLIVDEAAPPPVDRDMAIIIDDWRLEADGAISPDYRAVADIGRGGRLGNMLTVNGAQAPFSLTAAPCSRLRLRFLNAASARVCPLKFEAVQARVVAIDGQPCDPFDPLRRTVIMSPGSRFDIVVDLSPETGSEGRIGIALGVTVPLLTIKTEGEALPTRPPFQALRGNGLPPAIKLQDAVRADLAITGGLPRNAVSAPFRPDEKSSDPTTIWTLNQGALGGFSGKPLFSAKRGSPIVLAFRNQTQWAEVLHVHGHNFRLLHPFDDGWEPYFLDTLYLAEGQTSRVSFVADNPGRWAIRSSILEHFDGGVATWYEIL